MIILYAVLFLLPSNPNEKSLQLSLKTFETREECLQYQKSEEFMKQWAKLENKFLVDIPEYKVSFGCAEEEQL